VSESGLNFCLIGSIVLEEICAESNFNFGLFDFHMPVAKTADF
jgi:hypothetical protein